jgi:rRNA-processing protein FCF1
MKALLDTNIIIHRETINPSNEDIGELFLWLDRLKYEKCIHRITEEEIDKNKNGEARKAFAIKLKSYYRLPTEAPLGYEISAISKGDATESDKNDTLLLNEVYSARVDYLITEDRKIHEKARKLGIDDKVFTIEGFIEKVSSENPGLADYQVLSVKKEYFANINLKDEFFDSLRKTYPGFDVWFGRKANELAYVCTASQKVVAFLYLKIEDESEPYDDINPVFKKKKRLKIGTLKVQLNGFKLGERFLKIVYDNALRSSVDEIYVTIYPDETLLIGLLKDYGFQRWGTKAAKEDVYVRDLTPRASLEHPKTTYPFISRTANKFIVPIYPAYHTELFPDSILRTESKLDYVENEPHRNAISKVYISRSINRDLKPGDIIVFYRTKEPERSAYHTSVITTIGVVESVNTNIKDQAHFISLCRKRSVYTDEELIRHWNYNPRNRPFIVNFLYIYSFPKRVNLENLIRLGVIKDIDSAPQGFESLSEESFQTIMEATQSDENIVVD